MINECLQIVEVPRTFLRWSPIGFRQKDQFAQAARAAWASTGRRSTRSSHGADILDSRPAAATTRPAARPAVRVVCTTAAGSLERPPQPVDQLLRVVKDDQVGVGAEPLADAQECRVRGVSRKLQDARHSVGDVSGPRDLRKGYPPHLPRQASAQRKVTRSRSGSCPPLRDRSRWTSAPRPASESILEPSQLMGATDGRTHEQRYRCREPLSNGRESAVAELNGRARGKLRRRCSPTSRTLSCEGSDATVAEESRTSPPCASPQILAAR